MNKPGAGLLAETEARAYHAGPATILARASVAGGAGHGADRPAARSARISGSPRRRRSMATSPIRWHHRRHRECRRRRGAALLHPAATFPATGGRCSIRRRLNALIERSLANNPDLKAAQAALTVARENTLAGRGSRYRASAPASPPAASRIRPARSRRCPATTPSCTTCSRRRSACPTCRTCSASTAAATNRCRRRNRRRDSR